MSKVKILSIIGQFNDHKWIPGKILTHKQLQIIWVIVLFGTFAMFKIFHFVHSVNFSIYFLKLESFP